MSAPAPTLGRPRLHLRRVGSTNARARELAAAGAVHGTLVTAAEQTAGRGRQGRSWMAPPGQALLCSLVIREPSPLLALRAGLAVAEVAEGVEGAGGVEGAEGAEGVEGARPAARLKWPNDVLVEGRKVAGILVEGRPMERWAVLGIGINVAVRPEAFPPELRATAGTLGRPASEIELILEQLLARLDRWLAASEDEIVHAFGERDALRGRPVTWAAGRGRADGIDRHGHLIVVTDGGVRITLSAGEVHLR